MMAPVETDVLVVGAGPVGLVAARALARLGLQVTLLERDRLPPPWRAERYDPRVYAIAPASAALLDTLDLWAGIAGARVCPYSAMRVWAGDPERALRFEAHDAARAELGWIIEHGLIAAVAAAGLEGVTVFEQTAPAALSLDGEGGYPRLQLADGRVIAARLLVAADGADSRLRDWAGIGVAGQRYAQDAVVCHARCEQAHRGLAQQRFLASGPLAALPLADGRVSIVWSAELAEAESLMTASESVFRERLGTAFQGRLGRVVECTRRLRVPLRRLHADTYHRGALVLVGDAAHVIHPLAGQGVNLGFADVAALVEAIAEARGAGRDWAGPRVRARYERRRRPANADMLALTDALQRGFSADSPVLRAVLGIGLDWVGRIAPLRTQLVRGALVT